MIGKKYYVDPDTREPLKVHHCGAGGVEPLCGEAIHATDIILSSNGSHDAFAVTCVTCQVYKRLERGSEPSLGDEKWAEGVARRMLQAQRDGYERQMQAMIEEDRRKQAERMRGGSHDFVITDDLAEPQAEGHTWFRAVVDYDGKPSQYPHPTHLYSAFTETLCRSYSDGAKISSDVLDVTCCRCLQMHGRNEVESGQGIVNVPGVSQRVAVAVGYDDPTGDDVAADVGRRWRR